MTQGFLYIATGKQFVKEAMKSAESAKEQMPDIPVTLVTDEIESIQYDTSLFDEVIQTTSSGKGFGDPVQHMDIFPYDKTIYLDTDIYFANPIYDVFELLDAFDIAAAYSSYWAAPEHLDDKLLYDVPRSFPQYNPAVLAMNDTSQVRSLLKMWQKLYETETAQDPPHMNSPTFRKALYESDVRIATLTPKHHCRIHVPGYAVGEVDVFHGRLEQIDTPGVSRNYDVMQAVEEINSSDQPRVYTQLPGLDLKIVRRHSMESLTYLIIESLSENGVIKTIKKTSDYLLYKLGIQQER